LWSVLWTWKVKGSRRWDFRGVSPASSMVAEKYLNIRQMN
jgi:hypothetical protein